MFVNASNVRAYAGVDGIIAPWSEANLGSNIRAAGHALRKHRRLDLNPAVTSKKCHARKHQEDFHLSFQNFSGKSETMPCTPQDTNFSISRTSFTVHT